MKDREGDEVDSGKLKRKEYEKKLRKLQTEVSAAQSPSEKS